jgi:long-chain acyl-CoA synthetase
MLLSRLALGVVLAVSSWGAFSPPSNNNHIITHPSTTASFFSATIQDEALSDTDEDILFGNAAPQFPGRKRKVSKTGAILPDNSTPPNPLDHSKDPLVNKLRTMRDTVSSCPAIWKELAQDCPDNRAVLDEHLCDTKIDYTFAQMEDKVRRSAAAFKNLGVTKGVNVAVLGENSAQWLIIDHGIQLAGGASAVRGADAPLDELRYIYEHSDSAGIAVLQDVNLLQKLSKYAKAKGLSNLGLSNDSFGPVKTVILMHKGKKTDDEIKALGEENGVEVRVLSELLDSTSPANYKELPTLDRSDLSTIVYTSGTTGRPKGVMLTHGNLLHQVGHRLSPTRPYDDAEPLPGELMISLLPVWHITERTFELFMLSRGCHVVYSGIRWFKNDLAKHQPQWMVLVPRVLEKVALGVQDKFASGSAVVKGLVKLFTATSTLKNKHDKIRKGLVVGDDAPSPMDGIVSTLIVKALAPLNFVGNKLVWSKVKAGFGGRQRNIISGGSALAGGLETFYENCGIEILVGYGLTECSPLLAHRRADSNLVTAGCVGFPATDTEIRVVDPEANPEKGERKALPDGMAGVVIGRGPQVMKGYYKNPEATAKAIDKYGWFDTGDLGRINPATGDLILTGRAKDTIVLSNGENIEPQPIEDAIMSASDLIEQVMLSGQDGRSLIAISVLNPNALAEAGFIDKTLAKGIMKDYETVNDPKCTEEDCEAACKRLVAASNELRSKNDLLQRVKSDVKAATSGDAFRKWEQVSDVYVTLEPFAMANGLLTQSFKVKRDFVAKRYQDELP